MPGPPSSEPAQAPAPSIVAAGTAVVDCHLRLVGAAWQHGKGVVVDAIGAADRSARARDYFNSPLSRKIFAVASPSRIMNRRGFLMSDANARAVFTTADAIWLLC